MVKAELIYNDTYAIREVGCAGEVNMFLLVGNERAVLVDCGYGGVDLPAIIREVTELPVTVICTHGHIDHAFGSWMFEDVYLHPLDKEVYHRHGNRQMQEDSWNKTDLRMLKFYKMPVNEFEAQRERALSHEPGAVKELLDGQTFELGERPLRVMHMPGHTQGGVLVYDEKNKILFSGDSLNGQVWMSLEESTSLPEYGKELSKIQKFVEQEGITTQYSGHGRKSENSPKRITKLLKCVDKATHRENHGKLVDRGFTKGYVVRAGLVSILYKQGYAE